MTIRNVHKRGFLKMRFEFVICLFLVITTLTVYWQVRNFSFINLEDHLNITNNPYVQGRITSEKIIWAFTEGTWVTNYWAPLTWLSFLLDYQLYGLNPGGYHVTNVLLHITNTILLFFVFRKMSGALWQSAFVAALFGLHPLHVESVAWVTERKDVLSTLFWMLTILGYARYVDRPGLKRYLLVVLLFMMGLMSKPMVVTLPFVLLLLDYWPLHRMQIWHKDVVVGNKKQKTAIVRLVWEKAPLFFMISVLSVITFITQQKEGAVASLNMIPIDVRIANVLVSYVSYIKKMIWPNHLAVLYPHPGALPLWKSVSAFLFLACVSFLAILKVKRHPWFIVGWLWYMGTLVPVIGLVVIGPHAMADRYTYIPLIGMFIIVSWVVPELVPHWRFRYKSLFILALSSLSILSVSTWSQVKIWKNSITLFEHTLDVTDKNFLVHNNIGVALAEMDRTSEAIIHYSEAVRISPEYTEAYSNLGIALNSIGRLDEAIEYYYKALQRNPDFVEAHYNLAITLAAQGQLDEAINHYVATLNLNPDHAKAHNNIGVVLIKKGKIEEAIAHFQEALRIKPDYSGANYNLKRISKIKAETD